MPIELSIWSEGVSAVRPLRLAGNSAIELTASRYNGCIASVLQRSATDSAGKGDSPDTIGRLPLRIIEPELLAGKTISVPKSAVQPCLRRPVASDAFTDLGFPHCSFFHSCDAWDEHVLLLLHGCCDTDLNFASFGTKLQLPQTAVLAIRAPIPLLDMGFTWFDVLTSSGDVSFDSADAVASLRETSDAMLPLLQRLHQRQGYAMRNIFILGYSQGGTVALSVLHSLRDVAIGGVVSICGGPAPPPEPPSTPCSTTPVLFTLGQRDSAAESKARAWSQFEAARGGHTADCAMVIIKDKGEAMVQQGDEVRVLMQFFGQHLKLRSLQLYAQSDVVAVDNPQLLGALCASQGE